MISDNIKELIDNLQTRIVDCTESDNVLFIFDNQAELLKYKRRKQYICPNEILITIENAIYDNKLHGLRYKRFHFMRDNEVK